MVCDFCDKKASVFLTQLVDGQMKKVCLCESCAQERGVTDPTGFSLADVLLGGVPGQKTVVTQTHTPPAAGAGKQCPACGFTIEDLRRVRRFGCSECYRIFADELTGILRGMHKGNLHVGKVPKGLMEQQVRDQRLEELRARLDQAVASENYEEAAGLRDEIRQIELHTGISG
ncbi:protein-arginine kinase activator protein [Luteolibacter sp. LG18]|nr:protein-arginine kinase activator protein [Luteolibacter sp. LG18]